MDEDTGKVMMIKHQDNYNFQSQALGSQHTSSHIDSRRTKTIETPLNAANERLFG